MRSFLIFNQNWFAKELRELGYSVITCGYTNQLDIILPRMFMSMEDVLALLPPLFKPDVLLYLDDGAPITIRNIGSVQCLSFFYSVDTHHMAFAHKELCTVFDHIFVGQKDYLALFPVTKSSWLPLWASTLAPGPALAQREHKGAAVFVGTLNPELNPERVIFIKALAQQTPLIILEGIFTSHYPQSQIVLNQTVSGDLNFRIFEALGSGALLLTESSTNGLQDLFTSREHLITYPRGNVQEAAKHINYFLQHLEEAQEIATRGESEVKRHHLALHRTASILYQINGLIDNKETIIFQRSNNPLRYHGELLQLLVCGLSFTFLQRENATEALDNALALLQKCFAVAPEVPLSVTSSRLSYLATFAFDYLLKSHIGSKVRIELQAKAGRNLAAAPSEGKHELPYPADIEATRNLISAEIAMLHQTRTTNQLNNC